MSRPLLLVALAGLAVLLGAAPAGAIVGGSPVPPGRSPWMAAIVDAGAPSAALGQFCGGVVIAPRLVLTAAHCVAGKHTGAVRVLIGRDRLTQPGGRELHVRAIRLYPGASVRRRLDAAVLTVAEDAGVAPLALAQPGQDGAWAPGTLADTMGWGALNARLSPGRSRYYADRLREAGLPLVGDDACESAYGIGTYDLPYRPDRLLCAGYGDGRSGPCYGDSGGPLLVGDPAAPLDVGIVSGGDNCSEQGGYFDLFTRVDRIRSFALGASTAVEPDPVAPPRILGRLVAGHRVRCTRGTWRGSRAHFATRWTNPGSSRVLGRHRGYRVRRADVRRGLRCTVTARNRGGHNSSTGDAFSRGRG